MVSGKSSVPAAIWSAPYDPKTGEEIWWHSIYRLVLDSAPIFGHGLVYLQSGYVTPIMYAVKPDGKGDVTKSHIAFSVKKGRPTPHRIYWSVTSCICLPTTAM